MTTYFLCEAKSPRCAGEFKKGEAVEVEKRSKPIKLEVGRLL